MTRTDLALLATGAVLLVAGIALVYVPAALIVAGLTVLAVGLLRTTAPARDDDRKERR